jgi:hypothetical protein
MNLTKEELKAKAREMGFKVRESFMDDWPENLTILTIGVIIGYSLFRLL